jgi:TetR/AcrR family fatty acid metabolism transcriptional regulator
MTQSDVQNETANPRLSLKERQRQERVELILKEAQVVLAEKGYHEMSMDEIAARVGIAKGTIYLHFPSKEDLVIALVKQTLTNYVEAVEQCAALPLSSRERLELILQQAFGAERQKQIQLFMTVFSSGNFRKETIDKEVSMPDFISRLGKAIRITLEEGKANGEFRQDISTEVMVTTFVALTSQPRFNRYWEEDLLSPEELARAIGQIFFQGISQS